MTKQMLIYGDAVPISAQAHKDLSVRQDAGFGFARELGAAPLVAAEFVSAATEYTIVFARTDEGTFPWAMLGLESGQNVYVKPDGGWSGRYVPAFLRRYPFIFAKDPDGDTLALCIDASYDGVNSDGIGERLFDSAGTKTQYLDSMLSFASEYQMQFLRTKQFCERLEKLDLLEPATASFTDVDNTQRRIAGFTRINRAKLKAIPPDVLTEMFATDELELCFLHLHSLSNLEKLRQRAIETAA